MALGKDNCKTRRETFKFWDLARLVLEILRYMGDNSMILRVRPLNINLVILYGWYTCVVVACPLHIVMSEWAKYSAVLL